MFSCIVAFVPTPPAPSRKPCHDHPCTQRSTHRARGAPGRNRRPHPAVRTPGSAVGSHRDRAVRPRACRSVRRCPDLAVVDAVSGLLRHRRVGARTGGLAGASRENPRRRPAHDRRRDRRRGDRPGPRRRPADRHLRHLRRVGSIPDPAHRRLGAQPARSCSRTCHRHRP